MKNNTKKNIFRILDIGIKNKKKFYFGVIFSLISAIFSLLIPIIIGTTIEMLIKGSLNLKNLWIGVIIFVIIYVLQGISEYLLGKIGAEAMENLQIFFMKHILHLELKDSNLFPAGDMASRSTNDISQISAIVTIVIPMMIKSICIIVCTVIMLWMMNYKLTIVIIVSLFLLLAISHPVNKKLEILHKVHQCILGDISAQVTRIVSNMVIVKSFVGENYEFVNARLLFLKLKNNLIKIVRSETIFNVFLSSALMCNMVLVIFFAKSSFSMSISGINVLSAYILYVVQLLSPAINLINSITKFVEANGAFHRIIEVLNMPKENSETLKIGDFSKGIIRLSNLSFCYNDMSNGIVDINMDIQDKSIVAIVGPSGVGKTTIFSLILKLYDNYNGTIEIDYQNLKNISADSIRNQIAYVSQNNNVIKGTVMDNLRYGKNNYLTPEEVVEILDDNEMLGLFNDFSHGVFTDIGENGNKLSEGQKQRINIARAIISNPIILLLDEITSSLDTKTEQEIMKIIENQRKKSTIVIIAHRINTIKNADKIYVLNSFGKIECCGDDKFLRENSKTYRELTTKL